MTLNCNQPRIPQKPTIAKEFLHALHRFELQTMALGYMRQLRLLHAISGDQSLSTTCYLEGRQQKIAASLGRDDLAEIDRFLTCEAQGLEVEPWPTWDEGLWHDGFRRWVNAMHDLHGYGGMTSEWGDPAIFGPEGTN